MVQLLHTGKHYLTGMFGCICIAAQHNCGPTSVFWELHHLTTTITLDSRIVGAILKTVTVVPGRRWQGGCADTPAVFAIHDDIVESPQRVHRELQTKGVKINERTFYDSFKR